MKSIDARALVLIVALALASVLSGSPAPQIEELTASGPAPELAQKLMLFGQFVGDWDLDVVYHLPDGKRQLRTGEWHFGWVLEGRAIQDVWMVPARAERERTGELVGYGTTIRAYDPRIDAWHVTWNGVLSGTVFVFIARQQGDEIVMEQQADGGEPGRWIFSEIAPDSFRWRAVSSTDGGRSWVIEQEMSARRRRAAVP